MLKNLPVKRTLVTEFKVELVDLAIRNRVINESMAVALTEADSYASGEVTVTEDKLLVELGAVSKVLLLHSYQPFRLTLSLDEQQMSFVSAGFVFLPAAFTNVWLGYAGVAQRVRYVRA